MGTTILGLTASVLVVIAFLPQVIKSWKTRETKDISLLTYITLVIGLFLWIVYGFLINNLPILITNISNFILCSSILFLKIKNG